MQLRIYPRVAVQPYFRLRTVAGICGLGILLLLTGTVWAQTPESPFIQQLSQTSVAPGSGDLALTITGSGFSGGTFTPQATVLFIGPKGVDNIGTTTLSACFLDYCPLLQVTIPQTDLTDAGLGIVIVQNPFSSNPPVPLESNAVLLPISSSETNVAFANSSITAGNNPQGVVAADFNGDGKQDLAIANSVDNSVTILLSNGDGTFNQAAGSPIVLGNNLQPVALAAGDFNNDDNLDLAVANETDNSVSVLLGNGDGTFTLGGTRFSTSGQNPVALAVVDLDGDGFLDLAVVNRTNLPTSACKNNGSVALLVGAGDGTFSLLPFSRFSNYEITPGYTNNPICVGASPNSIVVGDFSGDGLPDLAVTAGSGGSCNPGVGVVTVMDNNDTFLSPSSIFIPSPVSYCAGKSPSSLAAGDFNGDGKLDVAVANLSDASVSILLNNGTTLQQPPLNFLTNGSGPNAVVVGDFNSDQKMDLAVLSPGGVSIMTGDGAGNFSTVQGPFDAGTTPAALAATDLNGDGRLDLVVTNANANSVTIMLTSPPLSFTPTGLNFGNVPEGAVSSVQSVKITNVSNASLNLENIGLAGPNAGQFRIDQTQAPGAACSLTSQTLAAGASCNVAAEFVPSSIGDFVASIRVNVMFGIGQFSQSAGLHGSGLAPVLSANPLDAAFASTLVGTISSDSPLSVTLSNVGDADATIAIGAVTVTGPNASDFTTDSGCQPATLAAGSGACSIGVTFKPSGGGLRTAQLNIVYNITGGSGPIVLSVGLAGNGEAPLVSLSSAPVTFGNQQVGTSSAPASVSLTNLGSWPLTFTNTGSIGGTNPGDFSIATNNCGSPLPESTGCSLTVTFTPTAPFNAATASRTATLMFTDNNNAINGSQQTVTLSGTATGPVATLSTPSLGFGGVPITTTSVPLSFTLTNTGTAPLAIKSGANMGIAINGGAASDFAFADNCPRSPSTIAVNANCTITVKLTPSATGLRGATLIITDNDRHNPSDTNYQQTVSLSGTGTDFSINAAPPSVTVSPGKFATYTLTITPVSGFNQTVSLACSVSPVASKTTCALPNSIVVNGSTAVASVTAKNASKGKYTLTFTATFTAVSPAAGTLSHSTTALLTVK